MIHICKCCGKGCDSCERCFSRCCTKCCLCVERCCSGCCECMNKFFSKPFSFCTFLSVFMVLLPGLAGIAIALSTWDNNKYYKEYNRLNDPDKVLCHENKFCDKLYRFLCYDWFVLICMFAFVFEIIWTSIGFTWMGELNSVCKTETDPLYSMSEALAILAFVFLFGGIFIGCCTACINSCCGESDEGWSFGGSTGKRNKNENQKNGAPPGIPIKDGDQGNKNIQPVQIQGKKKEETGWLGSVQKNFKWLGFGNSKPKPRAQPNNYAPNGVNQPQPPPMQNQLQQGPPIQQNYAPQGQMTNVNQNPVPNTYAQPVYGGMNQQQIGFPGNAPNTYGQPQPNNNQFAYNQQPQGQYMVPGQGVPQGGMVQQQQFISEGNNHAGYDYPEQGYYPQNVEVKKEEPAKPPAKRGLVDSFKNFWAKATK